jgi:hypothetical protein
VAADRHRNSANQKWTETEESLTHCSPEGVPSASRTRSSNDTPKEREQNQRNVTESRTDLPKLKGQEPRRIAESAVCRSQEQQANGDSPMERRLPVPPSSAAWLEKIRLADIPDPSPGLVQLSAPQKKARRV